MINVAVERQKRALHFVHVDGSYLYAVNSASLQKCEGGNGVGDYTVGGPPLSCLILFLICQC